MELLAVGNICKTQIEHQVYGEVAKTLDSLGYVIIKIRLFRSGEKSVLQVILEKSNGEPVHINDCEQASRCISAILDTKEDIIDATYNLEVMSTGVNRPLTRPEDFARFIEQRARIKVIQKIDGVGVFYGTISRFDGKVIVITQEVSSVAIEFSNISDAALDLIEREERFKEDKKTPEYQQRFEGKRVSERKSRSDGSYRQGGERRSFDSERPRQPRADSNFNSDRRPPREGERSFGPRRASSEGGERRSFDSERPRQPRADSNFNSDRRPPRKTKKF